MSQHVTMVFLGKMLLRVLLVLLVVRFDHVYYQHTVVLKDSSRKELLQGWGRIVDAFLAVLYGVWAVDHVFNKFIPVVEKW
ncbi:hypothetical protein [Pasteuria penetrans]|uniref:hypothetical protein n=1 Tax=Pasteuria penetrans TaxID=86005 RepID=UPI0011EDDA7E|nr:hypothetical protein [Pasteuria penetrans]